MRERRLEREAETEVSESWSKESVPDSAGSGELKEVTA